MRSAALVAVAAALLAACSPGAPPPDAPAADPIEGRRSAPGASGADHHPVALDVLTAEGVGPLRIGMTGVEVTAVFGPNANPQASATPDPALCDQYHPVRGPEGMLVMIENGRLTRITLREGATVRTDRGLGIGSTADEVRAAYGPGTTVTEPHKYAPPPGEYITYWVGGPRKGYLEDPAARGIVYSIEETRRVGQIHAGGPSIQYVEGCL
jgi:hypothetical protein